MNTLTLTQRRVSARFFAVLTITSLLLTAFPAAFFVAEAASNLHGPDSQTVTTAGGEYASGVIDASNHENLTFSFDYDSTKLDGTNDSFTYGWRTGGGDNDLDTIDGQIGTDDPLEIGNASVSLPTEAQVSDLEVYVYVTAVPGNDSDEVELTNITVTGDEARKIDICHWDGNEFSLLNVSVNSIGNAHGSEGVNDGDIIPAFGDYPGQNMAESYGDMTGAQVFASDCVVPDLPPETCDDGIENQNETGTDVGGVCGEPQIEECPQGFTGIYPECLPPIAEECLQGYTGTFPECVPPVEPCNDCDLSLHMLPKVVDRGENPDVSFCHVDDSDGPDGPFVYKTLSPWQMFAQGHVNPGVFDIVPPFAYANAQQHPGVNWDGQSSQNFIDNQCIEPDEVVYGCTDEEADNYDSEATVDDGSCVYPGKNTCLVPDTNGDNSEFSVGSSGETTLQTVLNNAGYVLDVNGDQMNYQTWNVAGVDTDTVSLTVELLDKYAGNAQTFGYYEAGDTGSFVPVFVIPPSLTGETFNVEIPASFGDSVGFAIQTNEATEWYSEFGLNSDSKDNMAAYNPEMNTYVLAFEDRLADDDDYNDLVVKINDVQCNDSNPKPDSYLIDGYKYDVTGEATTTLAGWTIELWDGEGLVMSTTTDESGYYYFEVPAGYYEVYEVMPDDWEQHFVIQDENDPMYPDEGLAYCEFEVQAYDMPLYTTAMMYYEDDVVDDTVGPLEEDYMCDFYNEYNEQPPIDVCLNIEGNQSELPDGYEFTDTNYCEKEDNGGGGSSSTGTRTNRYSGQGQVLGAATTNNTCPLLTDYMQMGWQNDRLEVMKLQLFLNLFKDTYGGVENPVTGVFGAITDANVKAFQQHYRSDVLNPWYIQGIVPHDQPTGFVYKTTLWKINSIVCPDYAETPSLAGEDLTTNVDIDVTPISD